MYDKIIINLFVAIVEFAVAFEAYYHANSTGKTRWWYATFLAILYFVFSIISTLVFRIFFVNIIVSAILFIALSFAFDIGRTKSSVISVLASIIVMSIVVIVGIVLALVFDYELKMAKLEEDTIAIVVFISKFVLLLIMQLLAFGMQTSKKQGRIWQSFAYLTLPLATFIVLFIQSYLLEINNDWSAKILIIVSAGILTLSNIAALFFLESLNRRERQLQVELFRREEMEKERGYYERTIAMATQSNKAMHDLKHILFKLYNQDSEEQKTNQLIKEMAGIAKRANIVKYTVLSGLNVLFNSKFKEIEDKKIQFEHHIFLGDKIELDEIDLCVMFGNLLDNAIEAASACKNKFIKLTAVQRKEYIVINVKNSTINKSVKPQQSSKDNKYQHGFGLQSIYDIAEKCDGDVMYGLSDGIFEIAVMLKNKQL